MSVDQDIARSVVERGGTIWVRAERVSFDLPNPDSVIHVTLELGLWQVAEPEQGAPFDQIWRGVGRSVVQVDTEFATRMTTIVDPVTQQTVTLSGAGLALAIQYATFPILAEHYAGAGRIEITPSGRFVLCP